MPDATYTAFDCNLFITKLRHAHVILCDRVCVCVCVCVCLCVCPSYLVKPLQPLLWRTSQDTVINTHDRELIALCQTGPCQLLMAHTHTHNDITKQKVTFYTQNFFQWLPNTYREADISPFTLKVTGKNRPAGLKSVKYIDKGRTIKKEMFPSSEEEKCRET